MEKVVVDERVDLPPEYCTYSDEGCDLAPSCLGCTFPRCRYDSPGEGQRQVKGRRNQEVARLRQEGLTIAELARRFGVTRRTVHRILLRENSKS